MKCMQVVFLLALCAGLVRGNVLRAGPADLVDTRVGTDRSHGSCVVGACLPHASVYPSPDSKWPSPHRPRRGQRHGFGPPTSGWWPGDLVTGFSMLHTQGGGGTPSYGQFRVEFGGPSAMAIDEARPYRFRCRLTDLGVSVALSATAHGAVFEYAGAEPKVNVRCKLGGDVSSTNAWVKGEGGATFGGGTYFGNWNPAPYDCWFYATEEKGRLRIAVSFLSVARAKAYHDAELAGRTVDDLADAARRIWDEKLSAVRVEGLDEAATRRFYAHLFHTFTQPRDRTGDYGHFAASDRVWDDHYTMWDTWKTLFPLMAIVDPGAVAGCVNSFASRFRVSGECTTCFTQGREFKTGQGGDEPDCVIADAYAKRIEGIDWNALAPLLISRAKGRTADYRAKGWAANGRKEGYCQRFKSGSATMSFAFQDHCAGTVLKGLAAASGRADWATAADELLRRSGNWRNCWNRGCRDAAGFTGFACGRDASGRWRQTNPRKGFNETFYEATGWEYSFFVPHDIPGLIEASGGRDEFLRRLEFALGHGLIAFDNEPSFHVPWLFDQVGRRELACKWAREMMKRFPENGCPGDDDSGAMASLYVFLTAGFYPLAGSDRYALHSPMAERVTFRVGEGREFSVEAPGATPDVSLTGPVFLNGVELKEPFIRHADIVRGGTLRFAAGGRRDVR